MIIKKPVIILSTILLFSSSVLAREGVPTKHSHDGRAHTHPLPAEGLGHNHKYKAPTTNEWLLVSSGESSSGKFYFYVNLRSFEIEYAGSTKARKKILVKKISRGKSKLSYWSLLSSDCRKGKGSISEQGGVSGTFDFVARNASGNIAKYICKAG